MAHIRTQIRAAATAQVTGLPTTGGSVFENRQTTIPSSAMPALNVSLGDEVIVRAAKRGRLQRQADLHVDIIDEDDGALSAVLDTIVAEVETALFDRSQVPPLAAVSFDSLTDTFDATSWRFDSLPVGWTADLIKDISPRAISEMYDAEGRKITGQARITFSVEYHTQDGTPGAALA